ncbi:hypothetical protein THAOC_12739 [Thalassiosira oceanica]|uniref:Uncharacterized protein n=1 Tax=Thalassiosira oceanica TaxID=159749 RepID=K0SMX6_THAOC|nr:hypothetical protein THAOC_12739 [Thalassiosira oceanica]|eukprot:EJK66349.1 hypothetical protein THAOC_12739 [Thalassiosira oceanica]
MESTRRRNADKPHCSNTIIDDPLGVEGWMSPNINPIFNGLTVKLALEPMEARFLIISLCSVDKGGAFSNKSSDDGLLRCSPTFWFPPARPISRALSLLKFGAQIKQTAKYGREPDANRLLYNLIFLFQYSLRHLTKARANHSLLLELLESAISLMGMALVPPASSALMRIIV